VVALACCFIGNESSIEAKIVKKLTTWLFALVLAASFLTVYWRKPVPSVVFAPVSTSPRNSAAASEPVSALPGANAVDLEERNAPAEKMADATPGRDGWGQTLQQARELATQDPTAALAWVGQLRLKEDRMTFLKEVCLQIARQDPAQAMTAAWDLGLGHFADESSDLLTLEKLAGQWAAADLPAALVWAGKQPADEEGRRDLIMKSLASALSQTWPEAAADLVATQMTPDQPAQINAVMTVVAQWAARNYAGASAWVDLFPKGPIQDRAKEELAKAVANQPPPETKTN
jgi:lambda repressor-like predicted transcriptional regulator